MATITNRASVSYAYGETTATVLSNLASTTLSDPITATKTSLGTTYRGGDEITYILTAQNTGSVALTNLSITDDLGTNTVGTLTTTPLSYVGPAYLYIDGTLVGPLTPDVTDDMVLFTVSSLAAGSNAVIVYRAGLTEYAPLAQGSTIVNTALFTAENIAETVSASNTVTVDLYANVVLTKEMAPNPVSDGGVITYTFTLSNYGNEEATDVVLTDTFTTPPTITAVTLNGTALPATGYTYTGGTLTIPPTGSPTSVTVPAATITTDATTGAVTVTPGVTTIVVTGTI